MLLLCQLGRTPPMLTCAEGPGLPAWRGELPAIQADRPPPEICGQCVGHARAFGVSRTTCGAATGRLGCAHAATMSSGVGVTRVRAQSTGAAPRIAFTFP